MANIQKRTYASGKTAYRVQVRLKGHPTEVATFQRLTDAKKWAQDTESAIRSGRHFKTAEAKKHTVAEAIDRYTQAILPNKQESTQASQKAQLEWWRARLGTHTLADLSPALLSECRAG